LSAWHFDLDNSNSNLHRELAGAARGRARGGSPGRFDEIRIGGGRHLRPGIHVTSP
jgi:hypothetical protein